MTSRSSILSRPVPVCGAVLFTSLALFGALLAGEPSGQDRSLAEQYFTDVVLVSQDGERLRLYSDLLKDRVVIVNSFFTTCTGVCPATAATLKQIQLWLGDRLGKEVYILSLSVNPATDTPSRLKEFGGRFEARPGWYFLSGEPENVRFALHKFGQFVDVKESHSPLFVVGNLRTGLWKKANGLSKPRALIEVVKSVLDDQGGPIGSAREPSRR